MKLYEIFIDNGLDYGDRDVRSKLIVAKSLTEAETRAKYWMDKEYDSQLFYNNASYWAKEWVEVEGFKVTVSR